MDPEIVVDSMELPTAKWGKHYNVDNGVLCVGMVFKTKAHVQAAIKDYSVRWAKREYVVDISSPKFWRVLCRNRNESCCQWAVRAHLKKKLDLWMITVYNGDHTCRPDNVFNDHANLDTNLIAGLLLGHIRSDFTLKVVNVKQVVKDKYGYNISYSKAYHGLRRAKEHVYGMWETSVRDLSNFLGALKKCNPGTIVKWKHDPRGTDTRGVEMLGYVFWAFRPCIDGFRHCRPVICVDATHLYTKYKHKLFVAVTMDENQNILPLVFALMNEEGTSTWGRFLNLLREHVVQNAHEKVTIISDCNKRILRAVHQGYGSFNRDRGCHRYCLRHLCSNVMSNYRNQYVKDLCWNTGSAKDEASFQQYMNQIIAINANAHRYLSNLAVTKSTLAHDNGSRYGIMTTNCVETFNGVLKGARRLPICAIVEFTFTKIANYFIERLGLARQMQGEGKMWTYYATNILTRNAHNSGRYIAQMINMDDLSAMVFKPASSLNRME